MPPSTCSHTSPPLTSSTPWDISTFPDTSNLLPPSSNGDWRNIAAHGLKYPRVTASVINETLTWPYLRNKLVDAADNVAESLQDSVNRAFEGQDLPAMHDKALKMVPSISMPTSMQIGRSMDAISDSVMSFTKLIRSETRFLDEDLLGDHLSFAHHMGMKARKALINQGICHKWQVMPSRETIEWQRELDTALARLFMTEKASFTVAQLFAMTPIWTGAVASKVWRLKLDTGMVEVVVEVESDEFEEERICLLAEFELQESVGCISVVDVQRGVLDEDGWMVVE
jgi:hypothetical protein